MVQIQLIVIVALVLLLAYDRYMFCDNQHAMLSGFWEADAEYCADAGLDLFCIYVDDEYSFGGQRAGYILASIGDELVINETVTFCFDCGLFGSPSIKAPREFAVTISGMEGDAFPAKQKATLYSSGKLVFVADDEITAVLYKNPVNTEAKYIADE